MSCHTIFDDEGAAWPAYSQALRQRLHTARSPEALAPFAINNMGFAYLLPHRRGCIIALNEKSVSIYALISIIYWLSDQRPERVIVQEGVAPSPRGILLSLTGARNYFDCLLAQRGAQPLFSAKMMALELSPFANRWEAAQLVLQSDMREETRNAILNKLFRKFFVITRRDATSGQFVIESVGDVYRTYRDVFGQLAVGTPLAATLDKAYGEWVCGRYEKLNFSGVPTVELVEARFPQSKNGGTKLNYTRLLIPFARGEAKFVLTASVA